MAATPLGNHSGESCSTRSRGGKGGKVRIIWCQMCHIFHRGTCAAKHLTEPVRAPLAITGGSGLRMRVQAVMRSPEPASPGRAQGCGQVQLALDPSKVSTTASSWGLGHLDGGSPRLQCCPGYGFVFGCILLRTVLQTAPISLQFLPFAGVSRPPSGGHCASAQQWTW